MEIILDKRWNYQFIKDNDKYILSVMCGTVGLFEVDIQIIYDGDINKRPKRFLVEYKVGNEPTIQKIFNN